MSRSIDRCDLSYEGAYDSQFGTRRMNLHFANVLRTDDDGSMLVLRCGKGEDNTPPHYILPSQIVTDYR